MKYYFAHQLCLYNTELEALIVRAWNAQYPGIELFNPNNPDVDRAYKKSKDFNLFTNLVKECDGIMYTTFDTDIMGAGVAREVFEAMLWDKPVFKCRVLRPYTTGMSPVRPDLCDFVFVNCKSSPAAGGAYQQMGAFYSVKTTKKLVRN